MSDWAGWADSHLARLSRDVEDGWRREIERHTAVWAGVAPERFQLPRRWKDTQRYQVLDGRLYRLPWVGGTREDWFDGLRERFERMLAGLLRRGLEHGVRPPDQDFVVNIGDYPPPGYPVWSQWCREGDGNVPIPGPVHYGGQESDDSTVRALRIFRTDPASVPWAKRRPLAGWRGSATGMYDRDVLSARLRRWLPARSLQRAPVRVELCRISRRHPYLLDAAISGFAQLSNASERYLRRVVRTSDWVPADWFLQFRYVVNVDGNVATSSFAALLGSGSTILRQASPYHEFWSASVRPGVHYVPVARDLSDLVPRLETLVRTGEGDDVQRSAAEFARRWLNGTAVDAWWMHLVAKWGDTAPLPVPHPDRREVCAPKEA